MNTGCKQDSCCVSVQGLHMSQHGVKVVPIWRLLQLLLLFPVFEDAPLRSSSHIPRFFACPKKKKETEKMVTSRGVDCHFCGPGRQKSWRKGKTSGDATRKCSKTADEVNKVSEGLAFEDHRGRVLQRTQTLNWDTATDTLRSTLTQQRLWFWFWFSLSLLS